MAVAKTKKPISERQNAIEKTSKPSRSLMNMAAVPKNVPAKTPSISAFFLPNEDLSANDQTLREAAILLSNLLA